ncbi:MAG: 6-pyruvoyl tetrahydropterin reductase, partial [Methylococcales bacterium]|nr:6-pyruvoyl tetrahydropterin reductase [Methylococcales bacterium]
MPQLFVEQLANVDFSYLCPDYGLVGETWLLDVCLQGKLDDQGMIFDFSNVKHEIKLVVEEFIDHKLLVPVNYEGLRVEKHLSSTEIWFTDRQQREIYCHSPTQGICEIDCMTINIAVVEQQLVTMVKKVLPANVTTIDLKLKIPETRHSYQYSHGLKKHEGACQHIAHGHRSDLKILNNKQISAEWENFWIEKLHRKYLADAKDIVKKHTKNNK